MLYVSNNGETCRDVLCQHPECWQSNVRRVREAVRQRNNIEQDEQYVNKQSEEKFKERKRKTLEEIDRFSLPTLKIVDMTEDLGITPNYDRGHKFYVSDDQIDVEKDKFLRSSVACHSARPPCQTSFRTQVPHTTPLSPSLPEKHLHHLREKHIKYEENSVVGEMTKINFHEIYDYDEVSQEWQDLFISTAYLVWCPSKKRRRKKGPIRASSAVPENRKGFKNFAEDMLPPLPERDKKRHWVSSKVPTGGQPYSPCRSPVSRMYNNRTGDYLADGEFIMAITKEDVPKSLITSKKLITEKPNTARKCDELKKSSNTKVLVDIAATLPAPAVSENCCKVENKMFLKAREKTGNFILHLS